MSDQKEGFLNEDLYDEHENYPDATNPYDMQGEIIENQSQSVCAEDLLRLMTLKLNFKEHGD